MQGLVQSLCCKVHEGSQMFVMVDYVRETTVKKSCQYSQFGRLSICSFCVVLVLILFYC